MKRIVLILVVIAAATPIGLIVARSERVRAALSGWPRRAGTQVVLIDGARWRPLLAWDFSDGPGPGAWSWGEWRVVEGELAGRAAGGEPAVWFLPCQHGRAFLLETEVLLAPGEPGADAPEAHLITRDSRRLDDETGVVLFADQARLYVRHRAGGAERHAKFVDLERPVASDAWHVLRLSVRDGRLAVSLDGEAVYAADPIETVNIYREPHLAVSHGSAWFRNLRIYAPG